MDIRDYQFIDDLKVATGKLRDVLDNIQAEAYAFNISRLGDNVKATVVANQASKQLYTLGNELDNAIHHLDGLIEEQEDALVAYERDLEKEFEDSIGDPNGLRGDDNQAVS